MRIILKNNKENFTSSIVSDVDQLPFKINSFDAITCFAVLHHLYNFEDLIKEISRVLKPGGIFYSDHDMELLFYKRFYPLLKLYRMFHNASNKYQEASNVISKEVYDLTEVHENGIDAITIASFFEKHGFNVTIKYHWFGLNLLTNKIMGKKTYRRGLAPLFSIIAIKI
ncbi:MAG: class I SAM-dependent methyltransferase [Candidatus Omnitrophica bacterium]|nr:class I SAM-dependent methyltransferase [Candidatus Omnitrophota bacterium]